MAEKGRIANTEHPLSLGSFLSWVRLVMASKGIGREYVPRLLFVAFSTFLTGPLRMLEEARYGSIVRRTEIDPSPIFIVGHWRTGTTHLHHLICRDTNFGYVTTFQAMAPGFCLVGEGRIKRFLSGKAAKGHPTREIDNIPLSFDAPQEEDFAIANMSPYSFIHQYTFPRQAPDFFERYCLFQDLPDRLRAEWVRIFRTILRKATLKAGGKRLVLKNPAHCGRIPTLLELFPNAKFIHICRNPYHVFRSTLIVYSTVVPRAQLQNISPDRLEAYVLRFYVQLMEKFLADKKAIPAGNLVEIKYEDLESSPLDQLRKIYQTLDLSGFAEAEPAFRAYVDSVSGYRKNAYEIDEEVIGKVNRNWQFAFDEWGYDRLE